jgi:serine/threonine protein kinase
MFLAGFVGAVGFTPTSTATAQAFLSTPSPVSTANSGAAFRAPQLTGPTGHTVARATLSEVEQQLMQHEVVKTVINEGSQVLASSQVQTAIATVQSHPKDIVIIGAVLVVAAVLWVSRRTIFWKLAQRRGYPEDVDTVINKYCVEQKWMSKGNSSAKFGVVSPLWNRKGRLAIKVSRDLDSWERETSIYKKLWGGGGPFVSLYDAEPNFDGRGANMLIQDYGEMDLLDYINENGPLSMRDIRRFGRRALKTLKKLHGMGLVWCDCKPENFVLVNGTLKAIDLETVSRVGEDIPGYTAETAPPELAEWEKPPRATEALAARKSYDMWSLGMLLLHMYLGVSYWKSNSAQTIVRAMRADGFEIDLSDVDDPLLRNLLKSLLHNNPNRRPNAALAGAHPFFLVP